MRWLYILLWSIAVGLGAAVSSSGTRLLVVLEEVGAKAKYSTFWTDLEGAYALLHTPILEDCHLNSLSI